MIVAIDPASAATRSAVRVRFCDTDLMGIVHHANYLAYFEMGRVEWLRRRGVTYADWTLRGVHLPVVDVSVRYRAPARFDDALVVEARLVELRPASVRFDYRLERERVLLAEGSTRLACIGEERRTQRFPPDILEVLASPERSISGSRDEA
jgi:acyl-CoA thioester hydrolase